MADGKSDIDSGFQISLIDITYKKMLPQPREGFGGTFFSFDLTTEAAAQKDLSLVLIFVKVNIRDENKEQVLASFVVSCGFKVEKFNELVTFDEKNKISIINEKFIAFVKAPAISTIRGVVYCELRGTYLHSAIMPIIDPSKMKSFTDKKVIFDSSGFIDNS